MTPKLDAALKHIRKEYGGEAISTLTGRAIDPVAVIPTGSLSLDKALGIGGYPRGRIVEVYGPEQTGKTTLCLHAIAEAQRQGGAATFIDAEHGLDLSYARQLGVDTDDLVFSQPDSGEQALNIVEALTKFGVVSLIVIDSVAALVPQAEIDGEMGDHHVGLHARLMSKALRKLTHIAHKTDTTLIFINQLRMKIGVMFGNPETTPGGNALKYYTSVRLDVRRIGQIKQGEEPIGNRARIKVVKNKLAPPFQKCELDIIWGKGFDQYREVIDLGVDSGLIDKAGAWYSYEGGRLGQGLNNVSRVLAEDAELFGKLRGEIQELLLEKGRA